MAELHSKLATEEVSLGPGAQAALGGQAVINEAQVFGQQSAAEFQVTPETWIYLIEDALRTAHTMENLYAQHPAQLTELPELANKLRTHTAPVMDRQLKAQCGISWLNVLKSANEMNEPGGYKTI